MDIVVGNREKTGMEGPIRKREKYLLYKHNGKIRTTDPARERGIRIFLISFLAV